MVAAIRGSAEYRAARRVGAYLPMRGEVDVSALFADDKRFAVPRTAAGSTRGLTFHLLAGATIERRAWGLREPAANAPMIEVSELDLLLIPGLLFDRAGYRLGFGKGYYDRALIRLEGAARRPALFGVSLARLVVAALPVEAHDVPLTHLVTEEGVTVIGG